MGTLPDSSAHPKSGACHRRRGTPRRRIQRTASSLGRSGVVARSTLTRRVEAPQQIGMLSSSVGPFKEFGLAANRSQPELFAGFLDYSARGNRYRSGFVAWPFSPMRHRLINQTTRALAREMQRIAHRRPGGLHAKLATVFNHPQRPLPALFGPAESP
jgi:hypothetical protein